MKFIYDDEGEMRLDGKGSLDEAAEATIPLKPEFVCLMRTAHDLADRMKREAPVYTKEQFENAREEVVKSARRLIEVMEAMPEAWEREEKRMEDDCERMERKQVGAVRWYFRKAVRSALLKLEC